MSDRKPTPSAPPPPKPRTPPPKPPRQPVREHKEIGSDGAIYFTPPPPNPPRPPK